ncbi:hypothetical protein DLAC_03959 [Tieghemostelium lacteum]|uniref:Cell division control protein 24 OB domain-containing protein n=1 Tax=Tieghemostelium lacteum TaxID=361077 RepID=A0A151ZRP5_TIELA|nr:hypothetical protein DLAC_03959 [Tieghemostelium lacteum]|eukprot:KYQ96673.1 hypothetical protein DLAC_03959 [Tieghemostelium lacteum]
MQFQESVNKLYHLFENLNNSNLVKNESKLNISNAQLFEHEQPNWNWVCNLLIYLLKEYTEGVTETIVKSELFSRWSNKNQRNIDTEIVLDAEKYQNFNKNIVISTLYYSYRKDDIANDSVIQVEVKEIVKDKNKSNHYILVMGDKRFTKSNKIEIIMILSQQYNYLVLEGVISVGCELRISNFTMNYSTFASREPMDIEITVMPTTVIGFMIQEDKLVNSNLANDINDDLFLTLKVVAIEPLDKVKDQVKWGNTRPYDKFLEYYEQQVVICQLQNSYIGVQLNIRLIFWDTQIKVIRLFSVNEIIQIKGFFFNKEYQIDDLLTLEYLPNSILYILKTNTPYDSKLEDSTMVHQNFPIDMNYHTQRLHLSNIKKGQIHINILLYILGIENTFDNHYEITVSSTNNNINDHSQSNKKTTLIMINYHDSTTPNQKPNLSFQCGNLVYFRNVFTNTLEEVSFDGELAKDEVPPIFFDQSLGSSYECISKLQGILSTNFLYQTISLQDIHKYSNSVITAIFDSCKLVNNDQDINIALKPTTPTPTFNNNRLNSNTSMKLNINRKPPVTTQNVQFEIEKSSFTSILYISRDISNEDLLNYIQHNIQSKTLKLHISKILDNRYTIDNLIILN